MQKLKLLIMSLALGVIIFSCSHEDETPSISDDCLTTHSARAGQEIEGEYIISTVSADSGGRTAGVARILEDNNVSDHEIIGSFAGENSYYHVRLSKEAAARIKTDSRVTAIEPDRVISICGCFSVVEPKSVTWNANKVGYGDGTGKRAWIIDTGVDSDHPDLNVDKNLSRSFVQDIASYEDDNGHGTHVSGIIGALNNNVGTLGIASGASIVGLKVLDQTGDGKLSSLLNALAFIRSNGKAGDVVNISVGFPEGSDILEDEIKSIANRGLYFTIAAGNESVAASTYSPARTNGKNIYTVSAVDSLNQFASFSNFGNDAVDFAAPGVEILSTYTDGTYAILSGTSMAAPHVAGLLLVNNGKINTVGAAVGDPDGIADPLAHK